MADCNNGATRQKEEVDHAYVEMEELSKKVVASIHKKVGSMCLSSFRETCIYKVPEKFRRKSEYSYTPEIVAIGPYHHGKGSLQAMEEHKYQYVHALLRRTSNTKLEECVEAVKQLVRKARKCYSEEVIPDDNEFVEIMVVDSLFIIEFFRKYNMEVLIDNDDSILNNNWKMESLVRDMILLENQLPMSVVERIFILTKDPRGSNSFIELALRFFVTWMGVQVERHHYESKHLLDLLCNTFEAPPRPAGPNCIINLLPCVTELKQAGVKFKKGQTNGNFLDISFSKGILKIPPLSIQDQTESFFRNLIIWEQCCYERNTHITSFAVLMDSLINSADDVRILRHCDIITNYLGDDKDVSSLFNRLSNEVTTIDFCYSELCDQVNAFYKTPRHVWQTSYYKTRWHLWRETLKRDYFHSPWAILSFLAALLIVFLTITGTLFSILSFSIHES